MGRLKNFKEDLHPERYTSSVPAVEQAARILICLSRHPSPRINLTEICKEVGILKSKGYSVLNTLQKFGFVQRDTESKLYSLGPGLMSLGRKFLDNLNYREVVDPVLSRLARESRNSAFFGMVADDNVFIIAKQEGDQGLGLTIPLGQRYPLTHGAHGKAIVAFLPEDERNEVLSRPTLHFSGTPRKLDQKRVDRELAACRRTGFASDLGTFNPNLNAVASPVFASGTRLVGTLFLLGLFPKSSVEKYGSMVSGSAKEVSRLLGADVQKAYGKD